MLPVELELTREKLAKQTVFQTSICCHHYGVGGVGHLLSRREGIKNIHVSTKISSCRLLSFEGSGLPR